MRSIDFDDLRGALRHVGSLDDGIRARLEGFVAESHDRRAAFGELLQHLAPDFGDAGALHVSLGEEGEDAARLYMGRLAEARGALGDTTVDEGLIRLGYAEGVMVAPDGRGVQQGPPARPTDRVRVLKGAGANDLDGDLLTLEEARRRVGRFDVGTIMAFSSAMKDERCYGAYARCLVDHLLGQGLVLTEAGRFEPGPAGQDPEEAAARLARVGRTDSDGGALMRQVGALVGRDERMAFTLEALYANGYHLDGEDRLIPPG